MRTLVAVLGLFLAVAIAHPVHDDRRRAMSSWSGWMPGRGMTMFSSGDDPWGMQPPLIWRMDDEGMARPMMPEGPHQPPTHSQEPRKRGQEEDEEDEEDNRRGGSKANASFNAWFPIVLGMYPGGEEARSRAEWRGSDERGVAAVANSVNHGKSGVASSHAIIYSGEPPSRRRAYPDTTKHTD